MDPRSSTAPAEGSGARTCTSVALPREISTPRPGIFGTPVMPLAPSASPSPTSGHRSSPACSRHTSTSTPRKRVATARGVVATTSRPRSRSTSPAISRTTGSAAVPSNRLASSTSSTRSRRCRRSSTSGSGTEGVVTRHPPSPCHSPGEEVTTATVHPLATHDRARVCRAVVRPDPPGPTTAKRLPCVVGSSSRGAVSRPPTPRRMPGGQPS